jgi:hypothetical protein
LIPDFFVFHFLSTSGEFGIHSLAAQVFWPMLEETDWARGGLRRRRRTVELEALNEFLRGGEFREDRSGFVADGALPGESLEVHARRMG